MDALRRVGSGDSELHVLITDDERIRRLNREYRKLDRPTDVLSFPDGDRLPTGQVLLGQVVVSLDAAKRQGREAGHDELRELEELVLHGILHLMGHDHERDSGEMNEVEMQLREELLG